MSSTSRGCSSVRDGSPIYAWPFEDRHVWRPEDVPLAGRVLARVAG